MAYMANINMADTIDNDLTLHLALCTMQIAQCMKALIYFDCLLHEDFKNIVHDWLLELYGVRTGMVD